MSSAGVTEPDFDVALSFAGEDRSYVERVAALLRQAGIRVFYDEFMLVELWGVDLYSYLDDIYRKRAKFCVIFVSENYARKAWTSHERQSAQARALIENNVYLLPVRLDDTELPGLRPTVGYVDARKVSPEALVELIQRKLANGRERSALQRKAYGIPKTDVEKQELINARPDGWEYLLFAGVLWRGKIALEPKFRDFELGYAERSAEHLESISDAFDFVTRMMREMGHLVEMINTILDEKVQERAFGPAGTPGDPERIEHLAKRALAVYEGLLEAVARIRGAVAPDECADLLRLTASMMDRPIAESRQFIDSTVLQMGTIPERIGSGESVHMTIVYTLSTDPKVKKSLERELDRLERVAHGRTRRGR